MSDWFQSEASLVRYKSDVLRIGKTFLPVECKDSVEQCLYCDSVLMKEGLYCDHLCEELDKEEKDIYSNLF